MNEFLPEASDVASVDLKNIGLRENWIPEPMSGCWLWLGATTSSGYGQTWLARADGPRRRTAAHRAVFQALGGGRIPSHLVLDHKCRNRMCVNPAHLEIVTLTENSSRTRKDVCKRGHPRSGNNLNKGGACRICWLAATKRSDERRRLRREGGAP